ncbi:MAG: glycosyltransferase [Cutibacterium sp.]|nr:glycosyltransferase [Cutibacterium sp.]
MEAPDALFRRVLEAYSEEGFPAEIISQWTIPARDAEDLVAQVRDLEPRRILEVGTFVGLSTMVMALVSRPDARIVSIDPNFPISVEMSSMGSKLSGIDPTRPTQTVAAAVAHRLGIAHKIEFVAGGFSVGTTFASRRVELDLMVPVVGPQVCQRLGPFDLAFIDGLHYADAVFADLTLVSRHLSSQGVVLMHDCIGIWGTNVRTGIFRFLTENSDWRLLYPPFRELYRSIGQVFRPACNPILGARLLPTPRLPRLFEAELPSIVNALLRRTNSTRIVELAYGAPLLRKLHNESITIDTIDLSYLEGPAVGNSLRALLQHTEASPDSRRDMSQTSRARTRSSRRYSRAPTLILSPLAMEELGDSAVHDVFTAAAECHALLVFFRTPPGEEGAATRYSRPLRRWAQLASEAGGQLYELPARDLATNRFLFVIRPSEEAPSSRLCGVSLFAPRDMATVGGFAALLEDRLEDAEQDELLIIHYGHGFSWAFHQMTSAQKLLSDAQAQLDAALRKCSEAEAHGVALSQEAAQFKKDLADLATRNTALVHDVSETRQSLEDMTSQNAALLRDLADAQHGLDDMRGQNAALVRDVSETRQRLEDMTAQNATLVRDLADAQHGLDDMREQNAALVRDVAEARFLLRWQCESLVNRQDWRHLVASVLNLPRTLFSTILDNQPEVLIIDALTHASRRGVARPCLMLSWQPGRESLEKLLADPRIGSVGIKDAEPTTLPTDLVADSRIGRYFHFGAWMLPIPRRVVYFVGPWRLVTARMVVEAARGGVERLYFRVGSAWVLVRPQLLYQFAGLARRLRQLRPWTRSIAVRDRHGAQETSLGVPPQTDPVTSEARAFASLILQAPEPSDFTPGRVVLVSGNLAPGGAERQVANTLVGLSRQAGVEPMLLAHYLDDGANRHAFHLPRVRSAGVPAREIRRVIAGERDPLLPQSLTAAASFLPPGLVIDIANLVLEFQALRPQVVHAWLDWDNIRAGLAAVIAGVPRVIISGRNLNPSHFRLYQPYMDAAYRALAMSPRVVFINNSRAGADDYADWIGIERCRIRVVHNGVDFDGRQRLEETLITERRRELGLPEDAFILGGVFRLDEEKRPMLWLEAAAKIAQVEPKARFVIFGQGSYRASMEARIRRPDLAGRVTLAGVTDDPLAAMSLFDLLILTSHGEGLPNVLLEAQWVGTPVITTRAGGAPEALSPGLTGWVVDEATPEAIAAQVLALLNAPDLLARAKLAAQDFVKDRFGVGRMITETVEVYGLDVTYTAGRSPQRA